MSPLWGPNPKERRHVIETLETLGSTSLNGLSAALSWPPRKTEKVVQEIVRRSEASIIYDPATHTIRLPPIGPVVPPAAAPQSEPPASLPLTADASVSGAYSGAPWGSSPRAAKSLGRTIQCPTCHIGLQSTGTGDSMYCPQCGKLTSNARWAAAQSSQRAEVSTEAPTPPTASGPNPTGTTPRADRRSQELFAAWVTSSPIPCPKCHTPLKHRAFATYSCPRCGQNVTFSNSDASAKAGPTNGRAVTKG
jgi:predicted RNA-binding Zn-ribbon protein involved in translation (DUF1610 family)